MLERLGKFGNVSINLYQSFTICAAQIFRYVPLVRARKISDIDPLDMLFQGRLRKRKKQTISASGAFDV